MALQIFGFNSIGTGIRADLGTVDSVFVSSNVTVGSTDATAIVGTGSNHAAYIYGTVTGSYRALQLGGDAGDSNQTVIIGSTGILASPVSGAALAISGYNSRVENQGIMLAKAFGILIDGISTTTQSTILNTGTIDASDYGIYHSYSTETLIIENRGTIKTAGYAIYADGSSAEQILNGGKLIGAVSLFGGDDRYDGRSGTITGAVNGGDGKDTLLGGNGAETFNGGVGDDVLSGGGGNDKLNGDDGKDTLSGGDGNDILKGGIGDDTLKGDAGSDTFDAGSGNDKLFGGTGNDNLKGSDGNDTLSGEAGNDKLDGGNGTDKLYGGAGADTLTGGAGADTFIFKAIGDSTVAAAGRDIITSFSRAQGDVIDLSAIDASTKSNGNQDFKFIGEAAFAHKAGELRFVKTGGDTIVSGDINGDGKADFSILVDATISFKATDFIL